MLLEAGISFEGAQASRVRIIGCLSKLAIDACAIFGESYSCKL